MSQSRTESSARRPYETTEGTPTLTFVSSNEALALPYHFLLSLRLANRSTAIVLAYEDLKVTIEGTNLHPLWRELQLFNVREIKAMDGAAAKSLADSDQASLCSVTAIQIERSTDADDS